MTNNITDLKDIAAETTVIASLLNHPEFILHTEWLKPKHFSQQENGAIYWAINELFKKGITNIDELNINNQLKSNKAVKELMENRNLNDISKFIELSRYAARDSVEEYKEFCKTVLGYAYKRNLYKKTGELNRLCFVNNDTYEEIDKKVHHIMSGLTEEYLPSDNLRTIGEIEEELFGALQEEQNDERVRMNSKFKVFKPFFRYSKKDCIVLAARMKSGKSIFILNEAIYQAMQGIPVLIIDTEIDDVTWYKRALAHISGIEFQRVDEGHWSKNEIKKINDARAIIRNLPLVHHYMTVIDTNKVYAMCKLLKEKMDLQFLCFDYIKGDDTDAFALSNRLGMMTNFLKNEIAGELNMCVLAACQLNRDNEVGSSDKIAMYASTIIRWRFKRPSEIMQDGGLKYGNIYAQIYYNRNGKQHDRDEWLSLNFIGDHVTIVDCEQVKKEEPFEEDSNEK